MVRSIMFSLALVVAMPLAALAQAAPPAAAPMPPAPAAARAPRHANRFMTALHALTLTPEQQQQISGFLADAKSANAGADRSTRRANTKKLRAQIASVLTPDQRTQLRATLKQHGPAAPAAPAPQ